MDIPHCPNPSCLCFTGKPISSWYIRDGFHHTKAFGAVQRFQCRYCKKTFSTQTFHIDYYAKKVVDYEKLIEHLVTASGNLDLYRKLGVSAETIENRFERLCRCVLAIHSSLLSVLPFRENLAADGLESFSLSQFYPNHVNMVAGTESEFIYALGFAVLRRKGRMTKDQREIRERLERKGKAKPKAVEHSMYHLLDDITQRLIRKGVEHKTLFTDEHPAYPRAFRRIPAFGDRFDHKTVPSKAPRTFINPLFSVNYIDRQVRKDNSDHVRETVQFAKCPSALMARIAIYRFYHNCRIPRRVREARMGNNETHAERAGVSGEELDRIIGDHWMRRCFLLKQDLGIEERTTWLCGWRNPGVHFGRYIPKYIKL